MKKRVFQTLLCTGVLMTGVWAQESSSQTPKQETLAEAIRFEKHKVAAAEAQARKDAAEAGQTTQTAQGKSSSAAKKSRQKGQADKAKQ